MKHWRFNTLLLIAILSTCLITISANDDDDDDGVTIEAEKIVNILRGNICTNSLKCCICFWYFRKIQSQHTSHSNR